MNIQANNWHLFSTPPSSEDDDEPGIRLREMMAEAKSTHRDHFERRVEAFPAPRDEEEAIPAPVPVPLPVVNANPTRSFPRTVAVSLVLLVFAGAGTLISTVVNALINKSIMDKGDKA